MLTYLEKFKTLPKAVQTAIEAPAIMTVVSRLSQEYKINLASTILKVMVGEVKLDALRAYLINEFQLTGPQAAALETTLRREVFRDVIDFLLGADQKSPVVFSEADEKEVHSIKKPVATHAFDDDIETQVQEILKQSRINFTDPLGGGKFKQVIKTYLRGSRDKLATLDALTKASELGGVALNRDTAERVIIIASNFLQKSSLPKKASTTLPVTEEYDLTASLKAQGKLKTPPVAQPSRPKPILDVSHELMPPVPAVVAPKTQPVAKPAKPKPSPKVRTVTPPPPPQAASGKVKMDDIRYEAKALSPVEELRCFTLINFRRLDPDPTKAVEKIKEKLELLGKENYSKKIEGIEAWGESPLNRLYLAVFRRSLEEGKSLGAIIERELEKDKNFLRPQELSAIIALNKSLKF